jgi:hypothetical protein
MAGTPMRHAPLSNEQILQALSESYNVVAAITKYQVFLTSGIGLPKDDAGRIELMAASMTMLEKIRTEIIMNLIVAKTRKSDVSNTNGVFAAAHESVHWPITTFRCAAQFGRYRDIADFGQPNAPVDLWVHGLKAFAILC